ncbi:MAG: hypothetical protein IJT36_00510, partial [Alphaproteobacteria bacterium]|nr:hypothetical protein [Alphaproteobacteria bacterium]
MNMEPHLNSEYLLLHLNQRLLVADIVKTLNKFYNKKMAYDEKYKLRTLSYRHEGHTLSQTSSIFQISITT